MGMLELGKTRPQKRAIVGVLLVLHLLAIAGAIGVFIVVGSPQLPPLWAALLVICTVTWLVTFVLLFVNVAYIYLKRD